MVAGHVQPFSSVEAGILLAKQHFGDYERNCKIADERYQALTWNYFKAVSQRDNTPYFSWWWVLVTVSVFLLCGGDKFHRVPPPPPK